MLNKKRFINFLFTFLIINSAIYFLQTADTTRVLVIGSVVWIFIFILSLILSQDEEAYFAYPALFIPIFSFLFMSFGVYQFSPLLFLMLENILIFLQVPFCFETSVKR